MKRKSTDGKCTPLAAFDVELADLQAGVEANLPPEGVLWVAGTELSQPVIMAALEGWRQLCAVGAAWPQTWSEVMADWPTIEAQGRTFVRDVGRALARHLQAEAVAGFESTAGRRCEEKTARRILAVAKHAITREIRGVHLRKRMCKVPGGRYPWVE